MARPLTLTEAVQRTGRSRTELVAALADGRIPGARKVPGGAWSIPPDELHLIDAPETDTAPAPEGAGAERDVTHQRRHERDESTPTVGQLVDLARRVERALDGVSTSRPARAAADAVWRHVQTATRHEPDRDGLCRHDGWTYPCPDRVDAGRAVVDASDVVLGGGS